MSLEQEQRFSRSVLWQWQRRFFESSGPEAWSRGVVPHYVTSNPFIADAYAQVTLAHLEDRLGGTLPRRAVPIVELGAGSGRFAFYFLQCFTERLRSSPLRGLPFVYVMSDFAEATIAAWRAHPQLRQFVADGQLDFAHFDAEDGRELVLQESGRRLAQADGPMVVLANYFFDGLPQDVFFIEEGALQEGLVTVDGPEGAGFRELELSWSARPIEPGYYGDAELDGLLAEYGARLPDTALALPVAGLRCCRFLRQLGGEGLLVLSADKGSAREEDLAGRPPPALASHGSFSLHVNYHALGRGFERAGGVALGAVRPGSSLTVMAMFAAEAGPRARAAFAESMERFGPDDFFALKKAVEPRFDDLSWVQVLAILRLGRHDPRLFRQCVTALRRGLESAGAGERAELLRALSLVAQRHFHIGDDDVLLQLGLLVARLGDRAQAVALLERRQRLDGPDARVSLDLAELHRELGHPEDALRWAESALAAHPESSAARALRLELRAARGPDLAVARPALRLAAG
jgi:hypothetical protein